MGTFFSVEFYVRVVSDRSLTSTSKCFFMSNIAATNSLQATDINVQELHPPPLDVYTCALTRDAAKTALVVLFE